MTCPSPIKSALLLLFVVVSTVVAQTNKPTAKAKPVDLPYTPPKPAYPSTGLRDVRLVAGQRVDLSPILEYEKNPGAFPEGRPMKHWKNVSGLNPLGGVVNGGALCTVNLDGGSKTIYLANVPAALARDINEHERLLNRISYLIDHIESESQRLKVLDRETPKYAYGNDDFVAYHMGRRDRVNKQIDNLGDRKDEFEKLTGQFQQTLATLRGWKEVSWNTGRKLQGKEIWDIGVKMP